MTYHEFTAPNGKLYRCCYDGVRLREIKRWRRASRGFRSGRPHWVLIWPKNKDPDRKGPLPKGLTPAMVAYA